MTNIHSSVAGHAVADEGDHNARVSVGVQTKPLTLLVLSGVLFSLLVVNYIETISQSFGSEGFRLQFDPALFSISLPFLFVQSLLFIFNNTAIGKVFSTLVFVLVVLPMHVFFVCASGSLEYFLLCQAALILLLAILAIPEPHTKLGLQQFPIAVGILVGVLAVCLAWIGFNLNAVDFNLDLSRVYDFRDNASAVLYSGIFGYLMNWGTKVCLAAVTILALRSGNVWFLIPSVAVLLLFFGFTSAKGLLFAFFTAIFVYYYAKSVGFKFYVLAGLAFIVFYGLLEGLAAGEAGTTVNLYFVRRALYAPAMINFTYFEVFKDLDLVFFGDGALSEFVNYPHPFPPPNMVSLHMLGHPFANVNTGFLGSAYMQLGIGGLFLYAITLGVLVKSFALLEISKREPHVVAGFMTIPFYNVFVSTDLPAGLLTHGIIFIFLILFQMSRNK